MHLWIGDKAGSGLIALLVLMLVIGGLLYVGNEALVLVGAKADPDDRRREASTRFEESCKAKGGETLSKGDWDTPACYRTLGSRTAIEIPIIAVYPSDAEESDAAVKSSGQWDKKKLEEQRDACRAALESWQYTRANDREYGLNLSQGSRKPRFLERSGVCDQEGLTR